MKISCNFSLLKFYIFFLLDFKSLQNQRKKNLLSCLNSKSLEELGSNKHPCRQAANDFINW